MKPNPTTTQMPSSVQPPKMITGVTQRLPALSQVEDAALDGMQNSMGMQDPQDADGKE